MIARYRALCARLGVNYLFGLINFTVGVASGALFAGFVSGLLR